MKINVTINDVKIDKTILNDGEYNVHECEFELPEEFNGLVQKAVFWWEDDEPFRMDIVEGKCKIPREVLKEGKLKIGVYAYSTDDKEELNPIYSPSPDTICVYDGSYVKDAQNSEGGTPTEYEQLESRVSQALNDIAEAIQNAERLDIDANKESKTTTITITKQDGSQIAVNVLDGADGVSLEYNWNGTALGVKREDQENYNYVDLKGDTGAPGQIKMLIVNELPLVGSGDTLYFVPKSDPEQKDLYDEYAWVNNDWERLGEKRIVIDLSDYYTKQEVNNLIPDELSDLQEDSTHRTVTDSEKTAWNNKLDEDDLNDYVKNTDYATSSKGGVVKVNSPQGTAVYSSGVMYAVTRTYANYQNDSSGLFVSKGTLDNVLNARIGDIDTALDLLNGEVVE